MRGSCLKIVDERSPLAEYIAAVQSQEYLEQTELELEHKKKAASIPTWSVVVSLLLLGVGILPFSLISVFDRIPQIPVFLAVLVIVGSGLGLLAFVAAVAVFVGPLLSRRTATKECNELIAKRYTAMTRIPPEDRLQVLRGLFGANVTSTDLLQYQELCEQSLAAFVGSL